MNFHDSEIKRPLAMKTRGLGGGKIGSTRFEYLPNLIETIMPHYAMSRDCLPEQYQTAILTFDADKQSQQYKKP